ncbi:MAG: hypothetical protein JSU63_18465 [Phycisphaerales bacterium]|nr:MAG: hypothetical protein JSU63_18465 [Phycisphaerales bacterium]
MGSHKANEGLAVFTIQDHGFLDSLALYVSYYLVRYTLSFVAPNIKNHKATLACFFDRKEFKPDIVHSARSGEVCPKCMGQLRESLNAGMFEAINKLVACMREYANSIETPGSSSSATGRTVISQASPDSTHEPLEPGDGDPPPGNRAKGPETAGRLDGLMRVLDKSVQAVPANRYRTLNAEGPNARGGEWFVVRPNPLMIPGLELIMFVVTGFTFLFISDVLAS